MSNALAIATVTATLRNLLFQGVTSLVAGADVTTRPPDKARLNNGNQLNLFLYQTGLSAAWRNRDMPRQVHPGAAGQPPLALDLFYLVTAYGANDDDTLGHQLLGGAMSVLHDHPLLGAAEIQAALADTDLHGQLERVRITPQNLSLDEMSRLWSSFQTNYRISTAYQVAVVLIESTRPSRAALPVLTRGADDSGVVAQAAVAFPSLEQIQLPPRQSGVRLDEELTLIGSNLSGDSALARFRHQRLAAPLDVPISAESATSLPVRLRLNPASDATTWPAGFYTVAVVVTRQGREWSSNELPFVLAPRLTNLPLAVARVGGDAVVTLECTPEVRPEQRASLLLGDREVLARPHPAATASLSFDLLDVGADSFFVRLRVDGADSLLVDQTTPAPGFDPAQKVTIT